MTKAEEKQTKVVGKIEPQKVDRLGNNQEWTFVDENGFEWKYTFQFPVSDDSGSVPKPPG